MDAGRPRFEADRKEREALAARFFGALHAGDVEALRDLLAADVHLVGDAGGKGPQWGSGIVGAEKVTRVLVSMFPALSRIGVEVEIREVNRQPGAVLRDRDRRVLNTLTLDVLDGQVQTIRSIINPDKLRHVGPVADAWALLHEATRSRDRKPDAEAEANGQD